MRQPAISIGPDINNNSHRQTTLSDARSTKAKPTFQRHRFAIDIDGVRGFRERSQELKKKKEEERCNSNKMADNDPMQEYGKLGRPECKTDMTKQKKNTDQMKLYMESGETTRGSHTQSGNPTESGGHAQFQELKKQLSHILFKNHRRLLSQRKSSKSLLLVGSHTPSRRLMRERSSPGIRASISYSTDGGERGCN